MCMCICVFVSVHMCVCVQQIYATCLCDCMGNGTCVGKLCKAIRNILNSWLPSSMGTLNCREKGTMGLGCCLTLLHCYT